MRRVKVIATAAANPSRSSNLPDRPGFFKSVNSISGAFPGVVSAGVKFSFN